MNATTATVKKTPVAKTIPKKIMGYLKFAHFIINNPQSDIIHTLFLDQSIEEIVALVNDVVVNGEQDTVINDLRKQFINSSKPPPKPKAKPKAKPKTNKTNADIIVDDLVTLARTESEVYPENTATAIKSKPRSRSKKATPPVAEVTQELTAEHIEVISEHTVEHGIAEHNTVEHGIAEHVIAEHNTVEHDTDTKKKKPETKKIKKPVNIPVNHPGEEVNLEEEKETTKKIKKPVNNPEEKKKNKKQVENPIV